MMGFEKGKPLKNLVFGLTHPFQLAERRPLLFLLLVGAGVFFLGGGQGWWSFETVANIFNK